MVPLRSYPWASVRPVSPLLPAGGRELAPAEREEQAARLRPYRRNAWLVLAGVPLCLILAAAAIQWVPERGELQKWAFVLPFSTAIMLLWEGWHCPRRWWLLHKDLQAGCTEAYTVDLAALAELELDREFWIGTSYEVDDEELDEDEADEALHSARRPYPPPQHLEVLPHSRLLWTQDGEAQPWRRSI